ncbi:D-glycero-beta-D-manno-heptose-7-phosphate kinase [Desulfobacula toluolica]|uniref:HldE: bifunctional protein [includes: D-beta-D-heptose 7-phosphate kinase and D-beta-D-heptose 7-phosphotranferase] n=1 Tax=Desulfobacula toluolica (strain DSM 7467 / Tol2) TaxID=651182 RepID=K0NHB8_DESTT|nr:D-glycero-beta-D-manno-heptose-7-phosphate kinase [Desulfobacula toluolica]CCK80661.1 HldE: bifunctional protein [includes: D-beta-D-heptose 7-phosphate kinase and D-beta-D-heptose 7-phosphotranferase] [Desulfobacula toluolica Tol2]
MIIDIDTFKTVKALVIGDLMIDEYLWGSVDRISPEAPVPVVCVEKESHALGGAGNVINNLVSMGAQVLPIGTAGTGKAGQMIFEKLEELGIETDGIISEPERPTTRKTRVIASNQQVLRIDKEIKKDINGNTLEKLVSIIERKISGVNLIIISDYNKGLVTKELVRHTVELAKKYNVLTLADPKALDFSKYEHVSILTPNKKEASLAANMDIKSDRDLFAAGWKIMDQVKLERLLITCGKDGMVLFEKDKEPYVIESKARQVFDVSGAGDTVISLLGLGLAVGATFRSSAMLANAAAGIVVAKVGTATASVDELKQVMPN